MYILIIILPLTSFLLLSCFGFFLNQKNLLKLSLVCILGAVCCSVLALFETYIGLSICVITLGYFLDLTFLSCPFILLYDELCVFMCFVVLIISSMVHYYSIEYMQSDPFLIRFISYLSLFTFFMLFLVTSGTVIQLFIGWEGVGLSSYLLINFWFTRIQAIKSALKAIVMNRFGDIGLYGILIILIIWYKCFDFLSLSVLFNYDPYFISLNNIDQILLDLNDLNFKNMENLLSFYSLWYNFDNVNFIKNFNIIYYLTDYFEFISKDVDDMWGYWYPLAINEENQMDFIFHMLDDIIDDPQKKIRIAPKLYDLLKLVEQREEEDPILRRLNDIMEDYQREKRAADKLNDLLKLLEKDEEDPTFQMLDGIIDDYQKRKRVASKLNDLFKLLEKNEEDPRFLVLSDIIADYQKQNIIARNRNGILIFVGNDDICRCEELESLELEIDRRNFRRLINKIDKFNQLLQLYELEFGILTNISDEKNIIMPNWLYDVLGGCILLAAIGKSAQLGLHTWLPDAMEGPTPVSALIHAATMVTAGVFVLIRFYFILENISIILIWISIIGSLTVFFAGSVGSFQYDLKKVIAYSTCSQLGYMVFACGISDFNISLFHLINHAFFKALLLLGAGAIIHSILDEQDMRKMGGLYKFLPLTYISIIISSLALIGIPFLSGFYSKDILLENAFINLRIDSFIGYILCIIGIFFTTIYSLKLLFFVFFNGTNINKNHINIFESKFNITLVLSILTILSLLGGFFLKEWLLFSYSISNIWVVDNIISSEFLLLIIKLLPFLFILGSLILCNIFWLKWQLPVLVYHFFNQKWFFDLIYNNCFVWFCINFSYFITFKLIDRAILEQWGSFGFSNLINYSIQVQYSATGFIYHYIFIFWNFCIWIFFFLNLFSFSIDYFYLLLYIFIACILIEDPNIYEWPGPRYLYYYE